jgi:Kdo2-lipid IVA lauroyltransferase/acyltransferase
VTASTSVPLHLFHPRYWPTWLGLGSLRLLSLLPYRAGRDFFSALGGLAGRLARRRRHIVRVNLRLCLPELTPGQVETQVDAHFRALGRGLFETALAWFASDALIRRIAEVHGLEHLDAARSGGQGVLLLTGHFTHLELAARVLGIERPFHAMYRPANNALVDYWVTRWRTLRAGRQALPKDDLKRLVRVLRKGEAVWYAPDQTLRQPNAVFLPMFGVPTLSITATTRLAEMGRERVVPFFARIVDGRYRIELQPALENFPGGDERADTVRVLGLIEQAARRSLPEYFWIHRRFKERPAGMADPYAAH